MTSPRSRRALGLAAFVAAAGAGAFWHCLPEPLFDVPTATIALSREGTLLGARIASDDQWRFPSLTEVPEKFETALTTFEDKRFRSHPGVDLLAVGRAARDNLRARRVVSGASTLTMQVIRLAKGNPQRTLSEKLVEMVQAVRLELGYDKDEVLRLYATHAPFGGNVVGLEAASWRYFGRPPEQLSWAESAMLAVLPNSPALIHPGKNRERLLAKRDALLHRLRDHGTIDALELELALGEPLPGRPHALPELAPHLLETLRGPGGTATHRLATTIDAELQRAANDVVRHHVERYRARGVHNAAVVVVDNVDFEVLAYVGNADWSVENEHGYAVDIVRRRRSTGSILKPLLYAAMLDAGEILPSSLVADVPTQIAGYMPENFDRAYRGAVPADEALARSLNVPAVRMLRRHGVERFYDFLTNAGVTTLDRPPDDYGLTLILGGAEATLWDLAGVYANLASIARENGPTRSRHYRSPTVLSGEPVKTGRGVEVSPGAAYLTLQALVDVRRPDDWGNWRQFASSRRLSWKTGTSYGLRDGWAVGVTPEHTIAVWVGNASGEGRPELTGRTMAAPILFDLAGRLPAGGGFDRPALHMKTVEVCSNDGFLAGGGCQTETTWVPEGSHFGGISPFNRTVHLDGSGARQVHGGCEQPSRMRHTSWFVLPPHMEHYYRRHHADYRPLPRLRDDCGGASGTESTPIAFLYPNAGTKLYIPLDLTGRRGRAVFEAVHREPEETLFWHLDDRYLGSTRTFHQQELDMAPGFHTVTLVDAAGNRLSRRFEVLGVESGEVEDAFR